MADVFITTRKAQELLGISKGKMTDMIERGEIKTYPDPLDKRVKLIKKADVEAILQARGRVEEEVRAA